MMLYLASYWPAHNSHAHKFPILLNPNSKPSTGSRPIVPMKIRHEIIRLFKRYRTEFHSATSTSVPFSYRSALRRLRMFSIMLLLSSE